MKVYVVYAYEKYEGCGVPEAVFCTEDEAKEYIKYLFEEAIEKGHYLCNREYVKLETPRKKAAKKKEIMKVYVVCEFHNYEGYDEPLKIFRDKKKAEQFAKEMDDGARGHRFEVFEREVE